MKLTIATLFAWFVSYEASDVMLSFSLHFQQAPSWPLGKPKNPPAALLLRTYHSSAVPVEFHNCNDSVIRVAGRLRVPTMRSKDILHQAKGESYWSSPLRSDGSQDYQAAEAGPLELLLSGGQDSQN
jgi:hypothetical protein